MEISTSRTMQRRDDLGHDGPLVPSAIMHRRGWCPGPRRPFWGWSMLWCGGCCKEITGAQRGSHGSVGCAALCWSWVGWPLGSLQPRIK